MSKFVRYKERKLCLICSFVIKSLTRNFQVFVKVLIKTLNYLKLNLQVYHLTLYRKLPVDPRDKIKFISKLEIMSKTNYKFLTTAAKNTVK